MSPPPLLTSHDATGHVHLIIGSNPLANARCKRSIEVGAKPILLSAPESELHYNLQKKIDEGCVKHLQKPFEEADLLTLGRDETANIVDAVFVTNSPSNPISRSRGTSVQP